MIESFPFWLVALAVASVFMLWLIDTWHPRCGKPMPVPLRPDRRSVYPCTRRAFHEGPHAHHKADSLARVTWT